ncbi:hypothetical protein MYX82_02090 [Acidobacteria bacterium AH-259-D05]|nr:hypothetical protein [Acidobacteria bacterium AH-259-D05]
MTQEDSVNVWEGKERRHMSAEKLRHVNDHLTPLAALIVVPGLLVAPLPALAAIVGGILIAFSVFINYLSIYLMKRDVRFIGTIRVGSNYVVNIFLSWLLYAAWPLVWMLLLLMSIGVAVYQSRRDSLVAGWAIALMLVAVHWNYGGESLQDWTMVGIKASIIILFNLFVNGLLRISSEQTVLADLPRRATDTAANQ